ncbi:hypothetical protein CEXT_44681 [Caerostris extrusa]|uniref:Uncharacterized protein n=1 Tax=Caerostris extrusa TaxID=172846 RepID=A0AAV4QNC2_CAEEX|nr:hypothetical protein CEXT_44681 [Caerostris extrusa]
MNDAQNNLLIEIILDIQSQDLIEGVVMNEKEGHDESICQVFVLDSRGAKATIRMLAQFVVGKYPYFPTIKLAESEKDGADIKLTDEAESLVACVIIESGFRRLSGLQTMSVMVESVMIATEQECRETEEECTAPTKPAKPAQLFMQQGLTLVLSRLRVIIDYPEKLESLRAMLVNGVSLSEATL